MLPWYHWPELEAPLRPRRRTGQRAHHTLHQQQLVSEQRVQTGPSACPLIGPQSPTRPLIGHSLSCMNTVLRRLQSHLSSLSDDTWELEMELRVINTEQYNSSHVTGHLPGPVSVSISIL